MTANEQLDQKDRDLLAASQHQFDLRPGPREGDIIRFSDGVEQRVTHVWGRGADDGLIQTADDRFRGTFYFDFGVCSYSGALRPGVRRNTLTLTDERKCAPVWFFHHGRSAAHNGVDAEAVFRVYTCELASACAR